jgi:hypothetical protein
MAKFMVVIRSGYVQVGKNGLVRKRWVLRQAEERGSRHEGSPPLEGRMTECAAEEWEF